MTAILERERLQHATALKNCHDEIKALQSSNDQLKVDLAELKQTISAANNQESNSNASMALEIASNPLPIIGTFYMNELGPAAQPRSHSSSVSFASPYSMPPGLPLGLNMLHIGNNDTACIAAYSNSIRKDRFDIHIDCDSNASLYGVSCSWLQVEKSDPDFQFGKHSISSANMRKRNTSLITFPYAYSVPPKVIAWISAFRMDSGKVWRLQTYAADITETGFTIHIDTWVDSILYTATASWLAYPADKANVFSGSFSTFDVRSSFPTLPQNSGYVDFGSGVFSAPPRIFLAIRHFDISNCRDLRLKIGVSDVSATGMNWNVDTWSGTIMYSGGASYIALA